MREEDLPDGGKSSLPHLHKMCLECGTEVFSYKQVDWISTHCTLFARNIFKPVFFMGKVYGKRFDIILVSVRTVFQLNHCIICGDDSRTILKRPCSESLPGTAHVMDVDNSPYVETMDSKPEECKNNHLYDHGLPKNWFLLPYTIFDWDTEEVEKLDGTIVDMDFYFEDKPSND